MAKSARERSTCAAGALSERLRRVSSWRSSAVSGRRDLSGGATWDTSGHEDHLTTIPDPTAIDPLVARTSPDAETRGSRLLFGTEQVRRRIGPSARAARSQDHLGQILAAQMAAPRVALRRVTDDFPAPQKASQLRGQAPALTLNTIQAHDLPAHLERAGVHHLGCAAQQPIRLLWGLNRAGGLCGRSLCNCPPPGDQRESAADEFAPDRGRNTAAAHILHRLVVIVAAPDADSEPGREADEPSV